MVTAQQSRTGLLEAPDPRRGTCGAQAPRPARHGPQGSTSEGSQGALKGRVVGELRRVGGLQEAGAPLLLLAVRQLLPGRLTRLKLLVVQLVKMSRMLDLL